MRRIQMQLPCLQAGRGCTCRSDLAGGMSSVHGVHLQGNNSVDPARQGAYPLDLTARSFVNRVPFEINLLFGSPPEVTRLERLFGLLCILGPIRNLQTQAIVGR